MWFAFMAAIAATIDDPNASPRTIMMMIPTLPTMIAFGIVSRADSVAARVLGLFRRAAGKIFATGVLLYGKEPSLRETLRWAREA